MKKMLTNAIKKKMLTKAVAASAAIVSGSALAGGVDVSGATDAIAGGSTAVAAIGVACLTVLGGAVVFKLIRRAM